MRNKRKVKREVKREAPADPLKLPVCQWATCPRGEEVTENKSWMGLQYDCIHRIHSQVRGTYECWFKMK